jgi:hypothetical protein
MRYRQRAAITARFGYAGGSVVHGASVALLEVLNDTVTGSLDGRLLVPFSFSAAQGDLFSSIAFADNGTALALKVTTLEAADLNDTLRALQNRSAAAGELCSVGKDSGERRLLKRQQRDTVQDPGAPVRYGCRSLLSRLRDKTS